MSESNAALAEQFRNNDPIAFTKLVRRHQQLVYRVCMKILGHHEDAEDVTQETFSRVAKYLDRWDNKRPIEPWLVAIAGNRCRTFLARRRSHQPLSAVVEPVSEGTNQHLAAESLREEVLLAVEGLPDNQRMAFELFHERGLNYSEIARQLGCPVGTVKTWVHRARSRLIGQLLDREVVAQHPRRSPVGQPDAMMSDQELQS